jgi:hypothetical protein
MRDHFPITNMRVHEQFSPEFAKHWDSLSITQIDFVNAIFDYGKNNSIRKRPKVGRLLDDFTDAIRCSEAFASRIGDATRSDQDNRERDILGSFLVQEGAPFLEDWKETLEALDEGAELNMKQHVRIWMGEDPDHSWQ